MGALPVIFTVVTYALLATSMPRTGKDYIYATRGLNPLLGFISSWGFWLTEPLSLGIVGFYDMWFWGLGLQIAGAKLLTDPWTMLVGVSR